LALHRLKVALDLIHSKANTCLYAQYLQGQRFFSTVSGSLWPSARLAPERAKFSAMQNKMRKKVAVRMVEQDS